MSAYLIGNITVKDETLWQEYVAGVKGSLDPYVAKILFRGNLDKVLAGQHEHDLVVVIEFFDQSTLDSWFNSSIYQALIPLRDRAADVVILSYTA